MRRPEATSRPAPGKVPAPGKPGPPIPAWLLAVLLAVGTMVVYWPATRCDFVNYDDDLYVTANAHVQSGITLDNVKWAFTQPVAANWHPLTVLSHMLDCQLFGLNPWGHHLVNVLLHALNAALVFVLLQGLTKATWRSLLVAALFAVHPLHVESVAWVAERKDVLSGFFGLLSLIFYVRYAQKRTRVERPASSAGRSSPALDSRLSSLDYIWAFLFLALGLMSKPMLVTWPFVMLLLDYWPLGRLRPVLSTLRSTATEDGRSSSATEGGTTDYGLQRGLRTTDDGPPSSELKNGRQPSTLNPQLLTLLWEKLPFFALAAAASVVTFWAQKAGGSLMIEENLSLEARVENIPVSYCRYLGKMFWPADLAVFYPHPGHWPLATVLLTGLLLVAISVLFLVKRQPYPFLLMGWLWFGGMLVPMIGLVQTGGQAIADRHTYLSSLGLLFLIVWGAYELTRRWQHLMIALTAIGLAAVIVCLALTRQQLGYWRDSETLFRHALAVTKNNFLAHNNLGTNLGAQGQLDEAIQQFQEAIRIQPNYALAHNNLGVALDREGRTDEAIPQYQEAIRLKPDYIEAHYNLGIAFGKKGQTDEAIRQFQNAIRLRPDYAEAHNNLGVALATKGQMDEAIANYRQAIRINPNYFEALNNLGAALAAKGQLAEAIENYRRAIQLNSTRPDTFVHLGMALEQAGRTQEAVDQYREALKLNPNFVGALNNLAWILAASPDDQLRNGVEAVQLAERACELTHYGQPFFIGTLAAAYAEAGRFPEAVSTAEKAEQLAADAGLTAVAAKNRQLLELFRAGKPYHEPVPTAQK